MATTQTLYNMLVLLLTQLIISQCSIFPTSHDFSTHNQLNWLQAESYCLSTYDTHLISIHDSQTFQQIQNEISDAREHYFWIGLSSDYIWSDGSTFDFGSHLIVPNATTNYHDVHYITLHYNPATQQLEWMHANSNDTNFWICNDFPFHVQSTQITSIVSAPNIEKDPLLYNYMIFIIIASLFCICCCIIFSFILIVRAATHQIHKLQQKRSQKKVVQKKQSLHSQDTMHSVLSDNERSCADEGIMDKFMCKQKSKSIHLSVDMSTGHIVMNIEDIDENEKDEDEYKIIPKECKQRSESVAHDANDDEDINSLEEEKKCKDTIELAPDEFIVSDGSMERRKITDGLCEDHEESNDGSVLEYEDTDGYYRDPADIKPFADKPFGGMMPIETNQAMEGHNDDESDKKETNDSDEEFYEEPQYGRKATDGFEDETKEIALRYEFMLDKSVNGD